jgi:hypothetical protein
VCPSYLDGDQAANGGPVIPVIPRPKAGTPPSEDRDGAHAVSMDADVGIAVQFSRSAEKAPAGLAAGLSKLNSMQAPRKRSALSKLGRHARSRRRSRSAVCRPGEPAAPILELPRKEVIQPHLPVRLPCYDFTPVTSPTFDCSLPCGLGHRLRVLLASVV